MAQLNANFRKSSGMSRFGEQYNRFPTADASNKITKFVLPEAVYLLHVTNPAMTAQLVPTLCALANAKNVPSRQVCAYYAGVLYAFLPLLRNDIVTALKEMGVNVNIVTEAQFAELEIELQPSMLYPACLAILGQAIMILLKNMSPIFMETTLNALRVEVGIPSSDTKVAFTASAAQYVREILGADLEFRKRVLSLTWSLSAGTGKAATVMRYVCGIVAWADMEAMLLIKETLLLTNSVVLRQPEVAMEVINLAKAYKAVNSHETPEFFGIVEPHSATCLLEKSRFPTLLAVAQHVKAAAQGTVSPFVSTSTASNATIHRLVALHHGTTVAGTFSSTNSAISFLKNQPAQRAIQLPPIAP